MGKNNSGKFSDRKYALPFGRYVGSAEVEPPGDEVLVGRDNQRAYLIDLLISTGRRGAYLVTGQRGVGKTSFVKYCIAEYETSVLSRFLRGNVGRGFWDRSFVLLFWLAILVGALLLSELLQLLVTSEAARGTQERSMLRLLILAPLGILLLYPCVYAKIVFESILQATQPRLPAGVFGVLAVIALGFTYWFLPLFEEPAAEIGTWIPIVCSVYLFAQATSFETWDDQIGEFKDFLYHLFKTLFAVIVGIVTVYCCSFLPGPESVFCAQLGLGLMLIGTGCIFRGAHQFQGMRIIREIRLPDTDNRGLGIFQEPFADAIASSTRWYIAMGFSLLFCGMTLWIYLPAPVEPMIRWGAAPLILIPLLLFVFAVKHRASQAPEAQITNLPLRFRPRPAWVLAAKAAASIFIALQLAHPLLSYTPSQFLGSLLKKASAISSSDLEKTLYDLDGQLFWNSTQEEIWLRTVLLLLVTFQFLEYEWIIRPFVRSREEHGLPERGMSPWDDWEDQHIPIGDRRRDSANFVELTLPWIVYRNWLPVLPVSVNLGFDRLDHRQVIQAMLVGLRERYERIFLAWNSGFANLGRFLSLLILLALMSLAVRTDWLDSIKHGYGNEFWASILSTEASLKVSTKHSKELLLFEFIPSSWGQQKSQPYLDPAWASSGSCADITASSPEGSSRRISFDFVSTSLQESFNKIYQENFDPAAPEDEIFFDFTTFPSEKVVGRIYFAVYHALLFIALLLLGQWLLHRIPILPYRENLRRIDNLLDSLSSRTKITSRSDLWGPARWIHSIFSDERVRETERDPVDPRTVELAFLQILEDIQKGGFRFPGAARRHLTLPSPEITFVFDELDKLGTRVDPESESRAPLGPEQTRKLLYNERERSLKLRALLSDLKNIIASAPARFIFVGGRDLHDEWLADHTSRQPLLSSIFNAEVYLPSLLTDHGIRLPVSGVNLHDQVEDYLCYQYRRSYHLSRRSVRKRVLPSFALSVELIVRERFASGKARESLPPPFDCETGVELAWGKALVHDFTLFLTLRSMGNPKRLRDLLASFIRPAGREITDSAIRWQCAPCRHVIGFTDIEIFRIQLLAEIYRHLALAFEERMVNRDDKFAISIFFLTDFIFKFHRRAFSWSNLERVDDLAHIHRLPDLREVQEEIVDHFSERFLHRVLNGMYAFRFRSDIAREVEYLSRKSAAEMAALNFTLDESQFLKAEYMTALKEGEGRNPDLVSALGELYEFDQDFERARHQYRISIDLLDQKLAEISAHEAENPRAIIPSILDGSNRDYPRLFVPWGVARLRLMLQIGMTYEHERDLELAEAEYRSARTLARALVRAYTDGIGRGETAYPDGTQNQHEHRLHTLKHLNILFQPMFAEAWVSEKFVGSIDTSTSLIENALLEIRRSLPFVREHILPGGVNLENFRSHANFALTVSQLHNKAGDLYFFKGRQTTAKQHLQKPLGTKGSTDRPTEGYLLRAHYHYAVGLHELRRYIQHRFARSKFLLSIAEDKTETLSGDALPDFLFRAAGGSVSDMAEATLARVSLFELLNGLKEGSMKWKENDISGLKNLFLEWLNTDDDATKKSDLSNWFGSWIKHNWHDKDIQRLIEFQGRNTDDSRLLMSLKLCLAGADLLEDGGYPEDAGRELLQVCETVTRYIWWGRTVEVLSRWFPQEPALWSGDRKNYSNRLDKSIFSNNSMFWSKLIDLAIDALKRADKLFQQSRSQSSDKKVIGAYIVGKIIPTEAATLLCSLGMAGERILQQRQKEDLVNLHKEWIGKPTSSFSEALRLLLQRHHYPMINRLNGLKILIDDLVLREVPLTSPKEDYDQAILWTEELLELNTQFDAPLHFTPFHSGATCALVWLWASQRYPNPSVQRIYRAANSDLDRSKEMYTMRRGYYEAISGLYYLYDDFNDRQIHYNHAIQMAGSELTAVLKHLVDRSRLRPLRHQYP